jgi:NAD(P)-dependent dehydrogenase (short-subunit alcohol dehydrogenase family)
LKLSLKGKNILITGAARGIGRETALSYAKAGASGIFILDLTDPKPVENEILQVTKAHDLPSPQVVCSMTDITDLAAVEKAAETVRATLGAIDILVNNAGYLAPYKPLGESDPITWWRNFEVNVKGVYLITRCFLPLVLQSNDKTIIVLSSIGALHNLSGGSGYETTKLVVLKINNYLNAEYAAQGLLVYAVAPGGVQTALASGFPGHLGHLLQDTPQMAADTIVFLTQERRDWLAARYVDSRWDMTEFLAKKEAIIKDDLLKIQLKF